jgi:hypothetical protein
MKHVIIVTTPDNEAEKDLSSPMKLQDLVTEVVERLFERDYSCVLVQSSFDQHSAVNAVCEMFNNDYRVEQ